MPENYIGPTFKTKFISKTYTFDKRINSLIYWGKKLGKLGLVPTYKIGAAGNLSFRKDKGFIITGTGKSINKLKKEDFVFVDKIIYGKEIIEVKGNVQPSTEIYIHSLIYKSRPKIKAIFHVHDDNILENSSLPITKVFKSSGTLGLAKEVQKTCKLGNLIRIKDHGIVCLGSTIQLAGNLILKFHNL